MTSLRFRSLTLPMLLVGCLLISGCIGSSQKRNPNVQRSDTKPKNTVSQSSLRGSKNIVKRDPQFIAKVLSRKPKNSWVSHDRDVYYHLGKDEAGKLFKVYPWLKVRQKQKAQDSE